MKKNQMMKMYKSPQIHLELIELESGIASGSDTQVTLEGPDLLNPGVADWEISRDTTTNIIQF